MRSQATAKHDPEIWRFALRLSTGEVVARESAALDLAARGDAARARPVRGQFMKQQSDFLRGKRGPVLKTAAGKTRITIRLDDEVLEWFRKQAHAGGGGN